MRAAAPESDLAGKMRTMIITLAIIVVDVRGWLAGSPAGLAPGDPRFEAGCPRLRKANLSEKISMSPWLACHSLGGAFASSAGTAMTRVMRPLHPTVPGRILTLLAGLLILKVT